MSKNPKNQKVSSYLLNDLRKFNEIFGKMCLKIILKATKKPRFYPLFRSTFFEKPQEAGGAGGQTDVSF